MEIGNKIYIYIYIDYNSIQDDCGLVPHQNDLYYCKGKDNGCSNMEWTVYGNNPYKYHSGKCLAALHSGIITTRGGLFRVTVKDCGRKNSETYGTYKNGVQAKDYYGNNKGIYISKY